MLNTQMETTIKELNQLYFQVLDGDYLAAERMNSLILQGPTLHGRLPLLQRGQGLAGRCRKVGRPRRRNDDRGFVEDVAEDAQQLEAMVDDVTGDAVETLFVGNGRRQKRRVAGSGRVGCRR